MRVPSPTSRSLKRIYLSLWDLCWAVGSPLLALYLRDPGIFFRADWTPVAYYWLLSSSFAVVAFFAFKIHDNMTRYFSVHEAIDIAETVHAGRRLDESDRLTLTLVDVIAEENDAIAIFCDGSPTAVIRLRMGDYAR